MRKYLKDGERCFTDGAFLIWHVDGVNGYGYWTVDGFEYDTYNSDGELINYDDDKHVYYSGDDDEEM